MFDTKVPSEALSSATALLAERRSRNVLEVEFGTSFLYGKEFSSRSRPQVPSYVVPNGRL